MFAVILACDREREAVPSARVDELRGHVTGAWTDTAHWIVERDLSIGVVTGDGEYEFGHVVDVDAARDGRIYVLDQQAGEIRVFDRSGSHLTSFGRPGRGPGELSNNIPLGARTLLLTPTDELAVFDPDNDRLSRFSLDGEFLGSFSLGAADGRPVGLSILPNGDYVLHRSSQRWNGLLLLGQNGEILDTIIDFQLQVSGVRNQNNRVEALRHEVVWSVLRDGRLVLGTSNDPLLTVQAAQADSVAFINLFNGSMNPILSRQEQNRFFDRFLYLWAEMFRQRGESEAWIESELGKARDIYSLPRQLPVFTALAAGPEGTIWIRGVRPVNAMSSAIITSGSALSALADNEWRTFDQEGQFLGVVTLPPRFTLLKVRDQHLYGRERDELGVQRVVRLRIRRH